MSVYDKVVVNSPRDFAPVQRVAVPGICPSLRHVFSCRGRGCVGGGVRGWCRKVKYCQAVQNLFPLPLAHWCTNTKMQNILLLVRSAGNYRCYVADPRFSAM